MSVRSSAGTLPNVSASRVQPSRVEQQLTLQMRTSHGIVGFDDTGGSGPLVIAVPAMGDLRAVGQDILALMKHLGRSRATIIGNSFSAGSALWAEHDAPGSVSEAVLIGPILRDPSKGIPWYLRVVLAVGLGGPWRVRFWLTYWTSLFPSRKPADFTPYRKSLGENLREAGRMAALKKMVYLSKSDTQAMLTRTELPVLVVMGTKDTDFPDPRAEAEWVVDQLGAKLLLIQDAGHFPHTEMPEQVGPAVVDFLRGGRS